MSRCRKLVAAVATMIAAVGLVVGIGGGSASAGTPTLTNAHFVLAEFGTNRGWRDDRNPRFLADITGDGRADIVGFGNDGVYTAVATGSGGFTVTDSGV